MKFFVSKYLRIQYNSNPHYRYVVRYTLSSLTCGLGLKGLGLGNLGLGKRNGRSLGQRGHVGGKFSKSLGGRGSPVTI